MRSTTTVVVLVAYVAGCAGCNTIFGVRELADDSDGGTSVTDAPTDGLPTADTSAGFCASRQTNYKFCEDFDEGDYKPQLPDARPPLQFDYVFLTPQASLGTDSSAYRSWPNSLLSRLPTATSNNDSAFLDRKFLGTASKVTLTFDVRVDSFGPSNAEAVIAQIYINEGAPNHQELDVGIVNGQTTLSEKNVSTLFPSHALAEALQALSWATLSITLDIDAKTCSVLLNGSQVLTSQALEDPSWTPGAPSVLIGTVWAASQQSAWVVRYDNVVVDWQ
jgi:hypothetical protein